MLLDHNNNNVAVDIPDFEGLSKAEKEEGRASPRFSGPMGMVPSGPAEHKYRPRVHSSFGRVGNTVD